MEGVAILPGTEGKQSKLQRALMIAESRPRPPRKKRKVKPQMTCFKLFLRIVFSHFGLLLLVVGYSVLGAWLFIQIESNAEETRKQAKIERSEKVNQTIQFMADQFWYFIDQNYSVTEWNEKVSAQLRNLESYVLESSRETGYNGINADDWDYSWTFPKSLLYSVSLVTTIGYGNVAPKTLLGRMITIIYSCLGIALQILFLASVGDTLGKGLRYVYSRLCCRWCRIKRRKCEFSKGEDVPIPRYWVRLDEEDVGTEPYMPTREVQVPISLNLLILLIYLVLGAVVFMQWEGWSFSDSLYFTFITVSTIGLGDMVPGHSIEEGGSTLSPTTRVILTSIYSLIGMVLVSVAVQLSLRQVVQKARWVAYEIGMIDSDK